MKAYLCVVFLDPGECTEAVFGNLADAKLFLEQFFKQEEEELGLITEGPEAAVFKWRQEANTNEGEVHELCTAQSKWANKPMDHFAWEPVAYVEEHDIRGTA